MSELPGLKTVTNARRAFRVSEALNRDGGAVVLDSTNVDSGAQIAGEFRAGNVIVLVTASGKFREAADPVGDRNAAAIVQSVEPGDAAWASQILTFDTHVGQIQVTLGAGDNTTALIVVALTANAAFARTLTASGLAGAPLVIATQAVGSGAYVRATSPIDGALAGFGVGGADAAGTDADYRVTSLAADLQDSTGAAIDGASGSLLAAHWDRSQLIGLTGEAEAVLRRNGSVFGD